MMASKLIFLKQLIMFTEVARTYSCDSWFSNGVKLSICEFSAGRRNLSVLKNEIRACRQLLSRSGEGQDKEIILKGLKHTPNKLRVFLFYNVNKSNP